MLEERGNTYIWHHPEYCVIVEFETPQWWRYTVVFDRDGQTQKIHGKQACITKYAAHSAGMMDYEKATEGQV